MPTVAFYYLARAFGLSLRARTRKMVNYACKGKEKARERERLRRRKSNASNDASSRPRALLLERFSSKKLGMQFSESSGDFQSNGVAPVPLHCT